MEVTLAEYRTIVFFAGLGMLSVGTLTAYLWGRARGFDAGYNVGMRDGKRIIADNTKETSL